jgi:hypothetical protein
VKSPPDRCGGRVIKRNSLARAAAFARCDQAGDHAPWNCLAAWQRPAPRRGLDDHAEPTAADVPAVGADVDTRELIAAQLPQIVGMHDASDRSQVRSCSREPLRGNQCLGRGENAHDDSMGTGGAR